MTEKETPRSDLPPAAQRALAEASSRLARATKRTWRPWWARASALRRLGEEGSGGRLL